MATEFMLKSFKHIMARCFTTFSTTICYSERSEESNLS